MAKLFKSVDDRFLEIGFFKVVDDEYVVAYERYNEKYGFNHVLAILHKANGKHLIQSYDKSLFDSESIGNCSVGLTYYETQLALKKMRQKKWKSR